MTGCSRRAAFALLAACASAQQKDAGGMYTNTYWGNNALRFRGKDYVRVPHNDVMNAPLMDSWTIECWIKIEHLPPAPAHSSNTDATGGADPELDVLNLVGFHKRHPTLAITRSGHAYTAVRDVESTTFGYEGATDLSDGHFHHIAATWNGMSDDLGQQTLSLYVDGELEAGGPKYPGLESYNAASMCTDNLCEEGMHIGGFYQSGGKGYTGQFFDGIIDEVRVWQKPRTQEQLKRFANVPLRPSDHTKPSEGLLFYFPFDEQGLDDDEHMLVVESRAYPWFGLRGNSTGKGRPVFVESQAPLKCTVDSLARPCVEFGVGNTRETFGVAGSAGVSTFTSATKRRYSHGTMAAAVLLTMLFSASISIVLTRAVLIDGLELSLSLESVPVAGGALVKAVKGIFMGGGAPTTSFVPAPRQPQSSNGAYATVG